MAKITTADLKAKIKEIVTNNPDVFDFDNDTDEDEHEDGYELHSDYKIRINKNWKRVGKSRLARSDIFCIEDVEDIIENGFWGHGYLNKDFLDNNNIDLEKCWWRGFVEPDGDNFGIDFITDPKDEVIIMYNVHVD